MIPQLGRSKRNWKYYSWALVACLQRMASFLPSDYSVLPKGQPYARPESRCAGSRFSSLWSRWVVPSTWGSEVSDEVSNQGSSWKPVLGSSGISRIIELLARVCRTNLGWSFCNVVGRAQAWEATCLILKNGPTSYKHLSVAFPFGASVCSSAEWE